MTEAFKRNENEIKRGNIFYAALPTGNGHVQGGVRPVLVVQNDTGNKHSPTVIVVPLTTKEKKKLPTHATINAKTTSTALCEQQQTIDKSLLGDYICSASDSEMKCIDVALLVSIGLGKIANIFQNTSVGGEAAVC